jgi:LEM3-like protein
MALHTQRATKKSGRVSKRPGSGSQSAYVYALLVDGVVRYVGKGRNGRMYSHLLEAKRSAARCAPDTSGLYPRMHRKLVEAVRAGSQVAESVIVSSLTDKAAYRLESRIIGEFHKHRAGQLRNTIDERFMDPRFLPDEWDDPEHPLYKLPRPLVRSSIPAAYGKSLRTPRKLVASAWARLRIDWRRWYARRTPVCR